MGKKDERQTYPDVLFVSQEQDGDDVYYAAHSELDGIDHGTSIVRYARTGVVGTVDVTTTFKERE